jgi:hypothetical protein
MKLHSLIGWNRISPTHRMRYGDCETISHHLHPGHSWRDAGLSRDAGAGADAHRVSGGGQTIDEFLDGFPTVSREQVIAFREDHKAEGDYVRR